jgi:O-antigen ligase
LTILGGEEDLLRMQVDDGSTLSRVSGTVGSPNYFARYLNFILPLVVSISFFEKRRIYRGLYYVVVSAGIVALILTFSRGAWTSFIISIIVVISLISWNKRGKNIPRVAFKLITVITILAIVIISFSSLIGSRLSSDDRGSAVSRLYLMQVAIAIISAHPFLGIGINNYTEVMHKYDTTPISISSFAYQVHNIYLQIAAEMGVFALFIFICGIYLFYKEALGYIHSSSGMLRGVVIGILGGSTTFLLQGFIDVATLGNILYKILWFYIGLTVGIKNMLGAQDRPDDSGCR